MPDWKEISAHISSASGEPFNAPRRRSVGGGSINAAHVLEDGEHSYFVKLNDAHLLDMFEAEAAGLEELRSANAIRVPHAVCSGISKGQCYLVLEYIPLGGKGNGRALGEQLAALHRKQSDRFGWIRDNTIGSTPQPNPPDSDWVAFYREHRLGFQYRLAQSNGAGGRLLDAGEELMDRLGEFFSDHTPTPSLLHGDLWGGNWSSDRDGNPVIFDPAVYYGDREADIAMTELFGGFPGDFYSAYNQAWQLDSGYAKRKTLYNLYHVLNHFNLFGGGYLSQAEHMTKSLLSELR
jgi:protein-ribulosamine 3-kinase